MALFFVTLRKIKLTVTRGTALFILPVYLELCLFYKPS